MKLGFLTDAVSRQAGGLFDAVRRLAQSIAQQDQVVRVFGVSDHYSGDDLHDWKPLPVELSRCLGPRRLGYAPGLVSAIRAFAPDVLMPQGLWKYSSAASLDWHRRTGRPCIIHPHGMLDPWAVRNSAWKKRVAGWLYEHAHLRESACIRALCESEAQSIRAFGLRNPICIIPNGIDLPDLGAGSRGHESMEQGARSAEPLTSDLRPLASSPPVPLSAFQRFSVSAFGGSRGPVVLYLGRLHPKKNLVPLLRAWAALQRDSAAARHWTLAIAGWDQGGYEEELKTLAGELGLAQPNGEMAKTESRNVAGAELSGFQLSAFNGQLSPVVFLGPQFGDAKAACYANCDAFILPSLSEGLPMVVLEAWAYAKPVVMTDECNLPEGFRHGAALRVGTGAESIATGLRTLVEMTGAERRAMGARGRALAAEKFAWPVIGAEMRRVCAWAVGGGPPPESVVGKS